MIAFNKEFGISEETHPPSREEVIAALKQEDGIRGDAKYIFNLWLGQKQKEMDESKNPYSRLLYNIEVTKLLLEAELFVQAVEYYQAILDIVDNEIRYEPASSSPELKVIFDSLEIIAQILQEKNL